MQFWCPTTRNTLEKDLNFSTWFSATNRLKLNMTATSRLKSNGIKCKGKWIFGSDSNCGKRNNISWQRNLQCFRNNLNCGSSTALCFRLANQHTSKWYESGRNTKFLWWNKCRGNELLKLGDGLSLGNTRTLKEGCIRPWKTWWLQTQH